MAISGLMASALATVCSHYAVTRGQARHLWSATSGIICTGASASGGNATRV